MPAQAIAQLKKRIAKVTENCNHVRHNDRQTLTLASTLLTSVPILKDPKNTKEFLVRAEGYIAQVERKYGMAIGGTTVL